jgi:hypothetical protein
MLQRCMSQRCILQAHICCVRRKSLDILVLHIGRFEKLQATKPDVNARRKRPVPAQMWQR